MLKLAIFIILSGGILYFSWKPLHSVRYHGFFRFFAFESILALILLNAERWFLEPFSALQFISWLLLIGSVSIAVHGFYLLRVIGKPKGVVENTTHLVRLGAYNYIRHPLYCSLLLLAWGVFFKDTTFISLVLVIVASAAVVATARVEENENLKKFGNEYTEYMKTTKMFIPFLI